MADLTHLPENFLPLFRSRLFNDAKFNPADFSVVKTSEFPHIDDHKVLESLFSRVKFYEPKGQGGGFAAYAQPPATASSVHAVKKGGAQVAVPAAPSPPRSADAGSGALPAGWVEKVDKSSGKTYYSNSTLKTTSWTRPT